MKTILAKIPNWLRILLIVVLLTIGANVLSRFTNPTAHAGANECLVRENDTGPYSNGCDEPINARYCFRSTGLEKTCGVVELAPGEKMSELRDEFDAAKDNHPVVRTTVHACKLPYVPGDKKSVQNSARIVDGCRRPEKAS
ncbi:hypothetical protein WNY37_17325 [Henriciella sp. AS95]|uniref:hypothetical protein n=1 Tax=Henriciella sp. AS95 TaxID=3135782 RepID=UPI0031733FE1